MKRCLIADSSDVIRKVARHFLEGLGFEIVEAATGPAAVNACKERPPDIVLLDWHLPQTTTVQFLSALRFSGATKRPFVIYCTTDNDADDITRAFSAGADAYFIKPFDRKQLVAKFSECGLKA